MLFRAHQLRESICLSYFFGMGLEFDTTDLKGGVVFQSSLLLVPQKKNWSSKVPK